jgi:hypothetical protein
MAITTYIAAALCLIALLLGLGLNSPNSKVVVVIGAVGLVAALAKMKLRGVWPFATQVEMMAQMPASGGRPGDESQTKIEKPEGHRLVTPDAMQKEKLFICFATALFIILFVLLLVIALTYPHQAAAPILLMALCGFGLVVCGLRLAGLWPFPSLLSPGPNFSSRNLSRPRDGNQGEADQAEESEITPRFSRTAIAGACWMTFFALAFVPWLTWALTYRKEDHDQPPIFLLSWVLPWFMVIAATFGTTILGWVAVSQIRRSAGKLHGLWLSVFDGLLFPLLAIDALIALLVHTFGIAFHFWTRNYTDEDNSKLVLFTVVLSLIVDFLIIRLVWRAVNKAAALAESNPLPAVEAWLAGIDAEKYPQSWDAAAAYFRNSLTREKWVGELEKVRRPLGRMNSRRLVSMEFSARDTRFEAKFATAFSTMPKALETVTFQLESDGDWRAIGYVIHPRNTALGWKIAFWCILGALLLDVAVNATINIATAIHDSHKSLSAAAAEPTQKPTFGPVIERVVNDGVGTLENNAIDLDTGKLVSLPPDLAGDDDEKTKTWAAANRVDAYAVYEPQAATAEAAELREKSIYEKTGVHLPPGRLTGLGFYDAAILSDSNADWETITPDRVASMIAQKASRPWDYLPSKPDSVTTWLFKTREGGAGILQITVFTDNPRGMKIRYKLVQLLADLKKKTHPEQSVSSQENQAPTKTVPTVEITSGSQTAVSDTPAPPASFQGSGPRTTPATENIKGQLFSLAELVDAGDATPEAAWESRYWVRANGDYDAVIAGTDPQAVDIAKAWMGDKATFRARSQMEFASFKGIQIVARKDLAADAVELKYKFAFEDGKAAQQIKIVTMVRVNGVWKCRQTRAYDASWDDSSQPLSLEPAPAAEKTNIQADRRDQIVVEDLALHMIVAIREKNDAMLRTLASDRIKGWPDALPQFAVELREHYRQSTGNEAFDMRASESLVDGELAAARCTGPAALEGKCLVLFFVKTNDGWRNHSLRASMENTPLAEHMTAFKKETEKENAAAPKPKGK